MGAEDGKPISLKKTGALLLKVIAKGAALSAFEANETAKENGTPSQHAGGLWRVLAVACEQAGRELERETDNESDE